MTDIDLVIRLHQIPDGTWTRCCSLNSRKPFQEGCVIAPAWRVYTYQNPFSPVRIQSTKSFFVGFRRYRPRLILNRCKGAKKYQRRGPGRIGGGKHEAHRTTFGPTVYGCAIRTGCIHNCAHVANSFFDSLFGDAIRKPLPALVEDDYSCESGESFLEDAHGWGPPTATQRARGYPVSAQCRGDLGQKCGTRWKHRHCGRT